MRVRLKDAKLCQWGRDGRADFCALTVKAALLLCAGSLLCHCGVDPVKTVYLLSLASDP